MKLFALALLLATTNANAAPLYFCVAPPIPCQTLTTLTSWSLTAEPPNYLRIIANGHDYGRVAVRTVFSEPNSIIVPDKIFAAKFE